MNEVSPKERRLVADISRTTSNIVAAVVIALLAWIGHTLQNNNTSIAVLAKSMTDNNKLLMVRIDNNDHRITTLENVNTDRVKRLENKYDGR